MHPILGQLRRLGLYVLAWIPLGAILLYLLATPGGLGWARAAALQRIRDAHLLNAEIDALIAGVAP
jgi:hypothetical protein